MHSQRWEFTRRADQVGLVAIVGALVLVTPGTPSPEARLADTLEPGTHVVAQGVRVAVLLLGALILVALWLAHVELVHLVADIALAAVALALVDAPGVVAANILILALVLVTALDAVAIKTLVAAALEPGAQVVTLGVGITVGLARGALVLVTDGLALAMAHAVSGPAAALEARALVDAVGILATVRNAQLALVNITALFIRVPREARLARTVVPVWLVGTDSVLATLGKSDHTLI